MRAEYEIAIEREYRESRHAHEVVVVLSSIPPLNELSLERIRQRGKNCLGARIQNGQDGRKCDFVTLLDQSCITSLVFFAIPVIFSRMVSQ
jgi:hypothetical protein